MLAFFGLTSDYMKSVYEQFFNLKYHGNWSFLEAYNLPIGLRDFFSQKLIDQKELEYNSLEQDSSFESS